MSALGQKQTCARLLKKVPKPQSITIHLQIPAQRFRRILAWHYWHDLERHKIGPANYPPLQQGDVVRFHQLETPVEVGCHPAAYELQSIRHHASLFAQAAVDRLGVLIAESFDDHEHHRWRSSNPENDTLPHRTEVVSHHSKIDRPMSALGQKQTFALQEAMSALLPIATAKADFRTMSCLLYPSKRTCAVQKPMSALGQKQTSRNRKRPPNGSGLLAPFRRIVHGSGRFTAPVDGDRWKAPLSFLKPCQWRPKKGKRPSHAC